MREESDERDGREERLETGEESDERGRGEEGLKTEKGGGKIQ